MPMLTTFCTLSPNESEGLSEPLALELLRQMYDQEGAHPQRRHIQVTLRSSHETWHLKVTFEGTITDDKHPTSGKRPKRRKDLQDLCGCIDFRRIQVLNDTVTEVILSLEPDTQKALDPDNEYASVIDHLWVRTVEDPRRVRYPIFSNNDSGVPVRELSDIKEKEEIDGHAVHKAFLNGDEKPYIYKVIDRPFYVPPDTEVLQQELRNLELLRGTTGIVQLVAAVVSPNPYQTVGTQAGKGCDVRVLRGLLLEYHPNGTLEDAPKSPGPGSNRRWCQWARQIASALAEVHRRGLAHMDLKPANVVISAGWDAMFIDVSGIGGFTREWLAPELLSDIKPDVLSWSIEARQQNAIWALGRIMLAMADVCCADGEEQLLRSVAQAATRPLPRISLDEAIAALSDRSFPVLR